MRIITKFTKTRNNQTPPSKMNGFNFDWKNEDLLDEMKKKKIAYKDGPVNKE